MPSGTYQVAHDNFAVTGRSGSPSGSRLRGSVARGPGRLLNAADGSGSRGSSGRASLSAATATALTGAGDDVVKSLVELAGHFADDFRY